MPSPVTDSEGFALIMAAIHNAAVLSMLGTMQVLERDDSRWALDEKFDFLTKDGKYIFPLSLPKTIIHMLEDRLGERNILLVNLSGSFESKKPEGSKLWTPRQN